MLVGAAPFGLIFGTLAIASGLPVWLTLGFSALVFAGSSQFVAVSLIGSGAALPVIWLTTFVVNLRHALYSATLLPYARALPAHWRWALAFWLTDETFAVVENQLRNHTSLQDGARYWLGSSLAMYLNWQIWTLAGVLLGQIVPGLATMGLDFAMVATFAAIVALQLPLVKHPVGTTPVARVRFSGPCSIVRSAIDVLDHLMNRFACRRCGNVAGNK